MVVEGVRLQAKNYMLLFRFLAHPALPARPSYDPPNDETDSTKLSHQAANFTEDRSKNCSSGSTVILRVHSLRR